MSHFVSKPLCNTQVLVVGPTVHLLVPAETVPCLKQMYIDAVKSIGIDENNIHWIRSNEMEDWGGSVHCGTNANRDPLPKIVGGEE